MQSLWMIVAAVLFSIQGVGVKLAVPFYGSWEIVFYRGMIGLAVMSILVAAGPARLGRPRQNESGPRSGVVARIRGELATKHLDVHFRRSLSGTIAMGGWYYAIAYLPLATAVTLNYSSALFVGAWVIYRALASGRRPSVIMAVALAIGFGGVLLLLQPTINRDQWLAGLTGAGSALLAAMAQLSVKELGGMGEPERRIVFYFSAFNALVGGLGASIFGWHAHSFYSLGVLVWIGIIAALAQLAMTRAYGSGRTLLTANLSFLTIVFSSFWGVFVFDEGLSTVSIAGIVVIIVSGIVASVYTARGKSPAIPPEPVTLDDRR